MVDQSSTLDDAYLDRNMAVQAFALLAQKAGYTVGVKEDPKNPEWPILYIDLPTGQVSWHLPRHEIIPLWPYMPIYQAEWDGHDTEEKRTRLYYFINDGFYADPDELVEEDSLAT